jgi:DNA-binding NtrC family response regulator
MLEATAIRETSRSLPPYLRPATAYRGALGRVPPTPSAALLESRPAPELKALGVAHDMADNGLAAHVLFVGDDPELAPGQLRRAFPAPLHRVQVADTGVAGLEQVRTDTPDVIVLDLDLPDRSGLEVYQQIRRIDALTPVIFVTRARRADAAIEAIKVGAYDCLYKPLDLPLLRRVVGAALDVARRTRQPVAAEEATTVRHESMMMK